MSRPLSAPLRRGVHLLLAATLVAFGLWAALETVSATDLYWAMATGRYIVSHGEIPQTDVFSYTYAGAPWSNQEWLSQILFWELFAHGGGTAVAVFRIVVTVGLVVLAAWLGWRRGASPLAATLMACAAAAVCRPSVDIRPQLFQFVGTLLLIGLVDAYRRAPRPGLLALLPLLMAVWVNAHFSFIFGLGVLALLAAAETVRALLGLPEALTRRRALWLDAAALGAAAACLLNPQGVHALIFPFSLLGSDELWRKEIIEWAPPVLFRRGEPFTTAFLGWYLLAQLVVALAALAIRPRRFDWSNALVVAVTAAMALSARRFGPLFALVAAPFGAVTLTLAARGLAIRTAWQAAAVGLACVATIGVLARSTLAYVRARYQPGLFAGMSQQWIFPSGAVEFLNRNPLAARLAHLYQWGGYLMFGAPGRQVFIDGRGHTVYPGSFYLEYKRLEDGEADWAEVLDRHGVSLVLWPSQNLAFAHYFLLPQQLRRSRAWRVVYDDGQAVVFAHTERGREWTEAYAGLRLEYPDTLPAQLFLADAYFAAGEFERARRQTQTTLARFGATRAEPNPTERQMQALAERTDSPIAWFHVAMNRDVRNDRMAAAEAYRRALERGLPDSHARYAREALARLTGLP